MSNEKQHQPSKDCHASDHPSVLCCPHFFDTSAGELAYGAPVEYRSGKSGNNQVFRAVFLRKHRRSSGEYAEIARELGRWNNPDNGHTHTVEWVPMSAIAKATQP